MKKLLNILVVSASVLVLGSCASDSDLNSGNAVAGQPGAQSVHGKVVDASNNSVEIMSPQGKCYFFSTTDAQKNLKHGLKVGNRVVVTYKGAIKGLDTTDAKVISVSDYIIW